MSFVELEWWTAMLVIAGGVLIAKAIGYAVASYLELGRVQRVLVMDPEQPDRPV